MFLARWPETSSAYHRYIAKKDNITPSCYPFPKEENTKYKVEIVAPPLEIIPNNLLTKPHKRLTLKRLYEEEETIYKIGDNIIKKINRKNIFEYIINNKYRLTTTDNLIGDELISLLFID